MPRLGSCVTLWLTALDPLGDYLCRPCQFSSLSSAQIAAKSSRPAEFSRCDSKRIASSGESLADVDSLVRGHAAPFTRIPGTKLARTKAAATGGQTLLPIRAICSDCVPVRM